MGLEAVIDVVLHLGYFKTFDMLAQGTYRLRIIMELKDSQGEVFRATPYLWLNNQFSHHKIVQKLFDSEINNNNYSASTPSFYIRYCDQECLINQMVIFRVEIPMELLNTALIEIKFELLNLDPCDEEETPPKNAKKQKERDHDGFSVLTHASIKSKLMQDNYHDFVNIVFPDYLFSYLDVFIHSTLIRLKYRGNPPVASVPGAKKGQSHPQKLPPTLQQYLAQKLTAKPAAVHEKELEVFPRLLLQQLSRMLECVEQLLQLFHSAYLQDEPDHTQSLRQSALKASKVFGSSRHKLVEQFLELKVAARTHQQESLPSCGILFDGVSADDGEINGGSNQIDPTEACVGPFSTIVRSAIVTPELGKSLAKVAKMPFEKLIELSSGDVEAAIEKLIEISMVADGNIQGYFFKLTDLLFLCFKPMVTKYREGYQVKQRRFLLANKVHSQVFQIDDLGYSFGLKLKETNNETSNRLRCSPFLQQSIDSATNMSFTAPAEDASFLFIENYQLQIPPDKTDHLVSEFLQVKDLNHSRASTGRSSDRPSTNSTQSSHRKTGSKVADFEKLGSFAIVPSFLGPEKPTSPPYLETPRETFVPEQRKPSEQKTQLSFDNMLAGIDDEPKTEASAPGLQWSTLDAPAQIPDQKPERLPGSIREQATIKIGKRRSMIVEERNTSTSRTGTGELELNPEPEAVQTASVALAPEESTMAESTLIQEPLKSSSLQEGELLSSKRPKAPQEMVSEPQGSHLVVFVHGYEGCSFDMKTLKNMFCYTAKPHVVCHCATANETDSTTDIEAQGGLLAEEILELVKFNFSPDLGSQGPFLQKISFVGHSLGGLVIRAALPKLASLASKMHALMTFGTPHLGCSNGSSTLIKTGFKVFTRIMGHKSLNQMNLTDASEIKNTFLMKLSSAIGMEWFSHVILFSSYQDLYVPAESARIEYGDIEQKDKKRSHYFKRMVQNLTGRLRNGRVVRVDMNVKQSGTLNNLTGRQAHIKILDTLELQALVVYTFAEYID